MPHKHISSFIRSYRRANGESLQSLANRSGVSRSMISQIESDKTSPTLVVLSKLANAMNIKIGDLVEPPNDSIKIKVFEPSADNKVSNAKSAFVCHQLRTKTGKIPTDFYFFYFSEYGKTAFSANISGATKYFWLEQGKLTVYLSNEVVNIKSGQMISFNASIPHRFESKYGELARGVFLVTYSDIVV
jgi:transcriptional regulator with XRE-family HTH domain